ncbi:MAG: hypothetical protein CL862_06380 [Cyanobium sp. NAT70]|nr:hypothetical protein [Cyanobium sp. NAT70]
MSGDRCIANVLIRRHGLTALGSERCSDSGKGSTPAQRKTTLKWDKNGELTSIDMTRIIDRMSHHPELNRCDLESR